MNGLDLFRSPKTAADEIADIVSAQCPPVVPENCDAFSCRECWLAWLTTGEPPKEKGPSDKQTAPGRDSAPYYPPTEAFTAAAQEAETLGYILKLLEKEAARECARRVIPTLDAILDFVIGFGLLALAMLGVAAACVAAGATDGITRTAALLGVGFITALSLHRLGRK